MRDADSLILSFALESAKNDGKSGNLHVLARHGEPVGAVKNAVLVVRSGNLIGCNYLNLIGKEAIRQLLQAIIRKAIFIERDVSNFETQTGTPSISEILSELHTNENTSRTIQQPASVAQPDFAGNLNLATDILTSVIGEDEARQQILRIMKQYSGNDVDIEMFGEACIAVAATYVGELTARIMFAELINSES